MSRFQKLFTQGNKTSLSTTVEECMTDRTKCKPSIFTTADFYCADVTLMGTVLWLVIMVLPPLCLNIGIMTVTLGRQFLNVVSMWPPFLFSGNFSPFLFGPVQSRFALSPWLTLCNIVISCMQTALASVLLNKMSGKSFSFETNLHIKSIDIFTKIFRTWNWHFWPQKVR